MYLPRRWWSTAWDRETPKSATGHTTGTAGIWEGGLCLFDDNTWKIGGSILTRDQEQAQVSLDSHGSVWWRAKDWESLGACGVAPGETAIWIWNDQYAETPQPSDLRDWGDGIEIAFDRDRGNVDGIASYFPLRGALIAGVADMLSSR